MTSTDTAFGARFPDMTATTFVANQKALADWTPTASPINTGMLSDIARAYIYAPDTQENFYARFMASPLTRGDSVMSARFSEVTSRVYNPKAPDTDLFNGDYATMISNVAKKNLSRQIEKYEDQIDYLEYQNDEMLLKNNQKKEIRFQKDDVILYEPNKAQLDELKVIITENTNIDLENGEAVSELSYDIIRYIFKFLTSIGDEVDDLDDEELEECIENGNNKISSLMTEIENMIREICDKLINSYIREIRNINEKFKILELNGELESVKSEFNTMAKKNNLNVTFDDLAKQVEEKKRLEKEAKK